MTHLLPTITTVRLSMLLRFIASRRMLSTHLPHSWWMLIYYWPISSVYCSTVSHTNFTTYLDSILSKIPSQPRTMKSWLSLMTNCLISGSAITTLGLPPSFQSLASRSPKVRLTESFPGYTLKGPQIGLTSAVGVIGDISVLQILPPVIKILFCSDESTGLWSLDKLYENLPPSALRTARLSPILAKQHSFPITIAMIPHDPLLSSLLFLTNCSSSRDNRWTSVSLTPSTMACLGFEGKCWLLMMFQWRLSLKQSQQVVPPCPSQMAKTEHLVDSLLMLRMIETLSSLQFLEMPMLVLAAQQHTTPTFLVEILVGQQLRILAPGSTIKGQTLLFSLVDWVTSWIVALESSSPLRHLEVICCFPSPLTILVRISDLSALGFRDSALYLVSLILWLSVFYLLSLVSERCGILKGFLMVYAGSLLWVTLWCCSSCVLGQCSSCLRLALMSAKSKLRYFFCDVSMQDVAGLPTSTVFLAKALLSIPI